MQTGKLVTSVLLAVCGTTPQILTETLYALHCERALPAQVMVLTTPAGEKVCRETLFGKERILARFFDEYDIAPSSCRFTEDALLTVQGSGASDDITNEEESAAFQKLCMQQAWLLTKNTLCRVDFSIAGGRKTMGACLALAAQCYGRTEDRLFHVLVTPAFESLPGFFYPSRKDYLLHRREPLPPLNAKNANVTLVPLPFLRLRQHFSQELLSHPLPPEQLFSHFSPESMTPLILDVTNRSVSVRGVLCVLPPVEFCLLLAFAVHKITYDCTGNCAACEHFCFVDTVEFLADTERLARLYAVVKVSSAARSTSGILNLSPENFMTYKAKLHRHLRQALGSAAKGAEIVSSGVRPCVRYGLLVDKKFIYVKNLPSW